MRGIAGAAMLVTVALASAPATALAQMSVEAVVALEVVDREPVQAGTAFTAQDGLRIWCWTRVSGAPETGTTLHHVWIRGDQEMADVTLNIGASSWRTWSNKAIPPEWAGDWRVEVRDADGTVLQTVNFTVS